MSDLIATETRKRNVAYKMRIGEILNGKPVLDEERFSFLELGNRKIVRVNVVANVIERFESSGDKKYCFVLIDDASGQMRIKVFGDDISKLKDINQGSSILVIGVLRYFNNEVYISPEIIKNIDPRYLLVRKLELDKVKEPEVSADNLSSARMLHDKIKEMIKNAEKDSGMDVDRIIMEIDSSHPDLINQEIRKLLEEGIIYEPRPGRVRFLG
jgi:RPA family protein